MRAFTVLTTLVAVALTGVLATPGTTPAALVARQATATPDIPPECQSACAAIQSIQSCGADLSCMCTKQMGQGIADCGTCGISYHKSDPNINNYKAQFQASINSYSSSCKDSGHDIGTWDVLGGGSGSTPSPTGKSSSSSPNGAISMQIGGTLAGLVAVAVVLIA